MTSVPLSVSRALNMKPSGVLQFSIDARKETEEEIRQRVTEILRKRDVGADLTSQEETILAYAYFAAGEQAVRMWLGSDAEIDKQLAPSEEPTLGRCDLVRRQSPPYRL
jgi:hypothetical protein